MNSLGKLKYSTYNEHRKELFDGHNFWKIRHRSEHPYKTTLKIIKSSNINKILDFGANDRNFFNFLRSCGVHNYYFSYDTDDSLFHDFYSLDEITERFDLVTMFAVVEHIQSEIFIDQILPRIYEILNPGGILIIYTNNIYHPLGIRMDIDHEVGYGLRELYAICRCSGFSLIDASRNGGSRRPFKWIYEALIRTVLKPFKIDYATSILMTFKKDS